MTTSTKILMASVLAFAAGFAVAQWRPAADEPAAEAPAAEQPAEQPATEESGAGLDWEMVGDSAVRLTVTAPRAAYLIAGMPWERPPEAAGAEAEPAPGPAPFPDYRVGSAVYEKPFKVFRLPEGSMICDVDCMPCVPGACIIPTPPRPHRLGILVSEMLGQ